ncbi:MAG: membrane protein insertase YidC, partial [Cyanobacteria bacterium SZAS LIN-5]|nr:membrane protein insertase YidC [Cyanobacteria bacterium SZAS LIN-5]
MNLDLLIYYVMLPMLGFFAKVTHSYGWAIILLTLTVRMIVWPLVAKSTRSMQAMSRLQPKLKALQEKYKDNKEQLAIEMAEFYKVHKMNPMGGCLPTLIQLPILFALFGTFTAPPFGDKPIDVKVNVVT